MYFKISLLIIFFSQTVLILLVSVAVKPENIYDQCQKVDLL